MTCWSPFGRSTTSTPRPRPATSTSRAASSAPRSTTTTTRSSPARRCSPPRRLRAGGAVLCSHPLHAAGLRPSLWDLGRWLESDLCPYTTRFLMRLSLLALALLASWLAPILGSMHGGLGLCSASFFCLLWLPVRWPRRASWRAAWFVRKARNRCAPCRFESG